MEEITNPGECIIDGPMEDPDFIRLPPGTFRKRFLENELLRPPRCPKCSCPHVNLGGCWKEVPDPWKHAYCRQTEHHTHWICFHCKHQWTRS